MESALKHFAPFFNHQQKQISLTSRIDFDRLENVIKHLQIENVKFHFTTHHYSLKPLMINEMQIKTSFHLHFRMWPSQWYLAFHLLYWLTKWPIFSLQSVDCNNRTCGSKFGTNCPICRLLISYICWVIDLMGKHLGRIALSCGRGVRRIRQLWFKFNPGFDGLWLNWGRDWGVGRRGGWFIIRLIYDIVWIFGHNADQYILCKLYHQSLDSSF